MNMKKLILTAIGSLVIIAAGIAVYRTVTRCSVPDAPEEEQVMAVLNQNDCFVCHAPNAQMPFYFSFPLIGDRMKEHLTHAIRFFDLQTKTQDLAHVDPVTLSMLDHAVTYGTMPIMQYRLLHWGTGLSRKEKAVLASWIEHERGSKEPVCALPQNADVDPAKAALGERMFNDTRLSLDGTITCATCHILEQGGADEADERVSEGINGLHGGVNAPTVYNAAYNIRQFWNGRAADLREQAEGPATNPVEMGDQTWDDIVARLREDKNLVAEFEALYPGEGLTRITVTSVIAEFEKSLITPNSRFDQFLNGQQDILSEEEIAGYAAFRKYACASCHTGVILGGQSFEYMPLYGDYFADRDQAIAYNSDDEGLKGFTGLDEDMHRFKVPTLRNIERTAPYFHDGTMLTMEDAVRAMAKYELGKDLSEADVNHIVAFMRALTGESKYFK